MEITRKEIFFFLNPHDLRGTLYRYQNPCDRRELTGSTLSNIHLIKLWFRLNIKTFQEV